VSCRRAAE